MFPRTATGADRVLSTAIARLRGKAVISGTDGGLATYAPSIT